MDQNKNKNVPIHLGEFREEALEKEFYNAEIAKNLKEVKFTIFVVGMIYFLFIIPEYFILKDVNDFIAVLICRSVIAALLIFLYFKVSRDKKYDSLIYWFTAYEVIISLSFIYISNKFSDPDFMIQAFSVMIIILAIFLINNRWLYSIFTSLFISIGYFAFAALSFKNISSSDFLAAIFHIMLVIIISSSASYSFNYFKRIQYLNNVELIRMAEHDPLTGIYNKGKFNKEYARLADHGEQKNAHLSIAMFDIDDFKAINDHYGHLTGDAVLVDLTGLIGKHIRNSDLFIRWGGEEFVLTFPDTSLLQATEITEKLRVLISEHTFEIIGHLSCSFGVASYKKGDDLDSVIRRADERLYRAKRSGKNKVM
ncbi:GGDEF domain-containing protein [Acetobacterium tundrae]|uniref:Diguanylate cyclase n=1 Tax=Acetobacterium tundrae TaxID=132932 RepID=A0ABR6WJB8_9FIRM|nr:GGDEF domain-containing protein [Acetobacterium tundrae]MBC3796607.1 diguanylate cyclase [Acetobacterium tundrae]